MIHASRKTGRRVQTLIASVLLAIISLAAMSGQSSAQTAAGGQDSGFPDAEKALRQRVTEFYTLVQTAQTARAESYIVKDGREQFRKQPSGPFLNFKIVSVDMQPGNKSADVVVEMTVLASMVGGMVPFQRNLHWQIEDGQWRLVMPTASLVGNDSLMGIGKGLETQAAPEELKFTAHTYGLGVMKHGEHKEVRFPFTNISDHTVKIAQIATGCDCLKVKTTQMEYKKGESGEIVIDFDSTNYDSEYAQTVVVSTNPGNIKSYLLVHGQVVSQAILDSQDKSKIPPQSGSQNMPDSGRHPTAGQ